MSKKIHRLVDGRLLQMNKRYSDLKLLQKEKISQWLYEEYRNMRLSTGRAPGKSQDAELLEKVYAKVQDSEMWIPFGEVFRHYKGRKIHFGKRFEREYALGRQSEESREV